MTTNRITESTLIPLGLVIALVGGIVWLTTIYAEARDASAAVRALSVKQDDYNHLVQSIDRRLSRIEGKFGIKQNDE